MARSRGELLEDVEYRRMGEEDERDEGADSDDGSDDGAGLDDSDFPRLKLLSQRPPREKFRILRSHVWADQEASSVWRVDADENFGFVAGEQLSTEDKAMLDAQQRPHVVFNRVQTILKAVAGMQINGRSEIKFLPRNNDDTEVNEILTAASKWMADGCDAEDEQSQAFQDCAVCGMGWTESRFTYDDDPSGMYVEESVDPREMGWDRTAKKKNLVDSRRMWRIRKMPFSDAMQLFRGKTRQQIDATWAQGHDVDRATKSIEEKRIRDGNDSYEEHDDKNEVTIVCIEWWEREPYWRVADPMTNTLMDLTDKEYQLLNTRFRAMGMRLEAVQLTRKRYYRAWLGNEYLGGGPAPTGDRFSWACITGEYDKKKRQFYGLTRVMRDPQMWANKFMSQIMQIMNSTAKGGILAEMSAFEDQEEAEEGYAMPEAITWMADGALSGAKPKIMPKPGQGDASAYVNLLQLAISSIKDVTGINLELLGQQDQNQPGILEHMRKQAGMTVLATLFDSLRRFMKVVGDKRLFYIQNRMSDGRLIRVVGQEYTRAVPLAKEHTTGTYDVIVDDAPTSPNQKEANWAIIQPMLAVFKDQLMANPQVMVMVMRYSPLPSALVEAIAKVIIETSNDPAKQQEAAEMKQLALQHLVAQTNKEQSIAEMNNAKAGASQATATYDIAMAQHMMTENQRSVMQHAVDMEKAQTEKITALAGAHKAVADASKSSAQAVAARVDVHATLAKTAQEAVKARTEALMAHRAGMIDHATAIHKMGTENAQTVHQIHQDRAQTALDAINAHAGLLSSVGGLHKDLASAHRERQGAVVDRIGAHVAQRKQQSDEKAQSAEKPVVEGPRQAPDGNWYIPDPSRAGKYLRVMK